MLLFVAALIYMNTEQKRTTGVAKLSICYSEIVAEVIGDMGQLEWSNEALHGMKTSIRQFKMMYVETFEEHSNSCR